MAETAGEQTGTRDLSRGRAMNTSAVSPNTEQV